MKVRKREGCYFAGACSATLLRYNSDLCHSFFLKSSTAFAGQILSNLVAMNSDQFAKEKLGRDSKIGEVVMDKMNTKGGSLSIGHPFGATGSRLVTTASRRLQQEGQRFALLAACADGGMGHGCLLERYDN